MDRAKFPINKLITIEMPNSGVSDEGIAVINKYLAEQQLPPLPATFERDWLVTRGDPAGTFPKRWAQVVYRQAKHRATAEQLGTVGNLAQAHTLKHHNYYIDFDDKLNWKSGDFGDSGSCFWGGRSTAREMLRNNGGLAVRFFTDETGRKGEGRAWIVFPSERTRIGLEKGVEFTPEQALKSFMENGCIIFNAYGAELVKMARVLATYLGLSYASSNIHNRGGDDGMLYLNGGRGYFLAMPEITEAIREIDLNIRDNHVNCSECGNRVGANQAHTFNNREYCNTCWTNTFITCNHCGEHKPKREAEMVKVGGLQVHWCRQCLFQAGARCDHCDQYVPSGEIKTLKSKLTLCDDCFGKYGATCTVCNLNTYVLDTTRVQEKPVCTNCLALHFKKAESGDLERIAVPA